MGFTNLIQRVLNPEGRPAAQSQEEKQQIPPSQRICFAIKIYTSMVDVPDNEDVTEVKELEAGKSYDVVITCEQSPGHADREDFPITGDFTLLVKGIFSRTTPHPPPHHKFSVKYEEIGKPWHELSWSLTLPADLPAGELTLSLTLFRPSFHPRSNIAISPFPVRSTTHQQDSQLLDACNIETELPDHIAVLAIASANMTALSDSVEIKTTNQCISDRIIPLPVSAIAGIAQRFPKQSAVEIIKIIRAFSIDQAGELACWLRDFRAACQEYQQHPCIIIVDTTSRVEVPWELLEIDAFEYLGAVAQVVRWYPVKAYGRPKMLPVKRILYTGSVLTYLDQNLKFTQRERDALRHFMKEDLPVLGSLRGRLRQKNSLTQFSFVYVACHGVDGNTLGSHDLQQPDQTLRSLETAPMPEHPEPRPIFFVNSCESARMLRHSKTDPSSFATSFLVRCASSYIGTLAPVGSNKASEIGASIIMQAGNTEGVQVAEALRVIRAQVVEKFYLADQEDEAPKELYSELFYTFMYVYYGNPLARLRLLTAESEEKGA